MNKSPMALRQGWEHHQTLALKILAKGSLLHPPLQAPSVQQMPFAPGLFEFQQDQGPKIQALLAVRRIQGSVYGQTLPVQRVEKGLAVVFNPQTSLEVVGNQGLQARHPVLTRLQALRQQIHIGPVGPWVVGGFAGLQSGSYFYLVTAGVFLFEFPKGALVGVIGSQSEFVTAKATGSMRVKKNQFVGIKIIVGIKRFTLSIHLDITMALVHRLPQKFQIRLRAEVFAIVATHQSRRLGQFSQVQAFHRFDSKRMGLFIS